MPVKVFLMSIPMIGLFFVEHFFLRKLPALHQAYELTIGFLPRAFGGVIFVNVIATTVILIMLGLRVPKAREAFMKKALKDGDKDAEARYSYPKMYAEGFSENAGKFNCVQRGHQQAFETYSQVLALSLIGGILYPITCTVCGLLWCLARITWANGYASGDPKKRYTHWSSHGIWITLVTLAFAAGGVAVNLFIGN